LHVRHLAAKDLAAPFCVGKCSRYHDCFSSRIVELTVAVVVTWLIALNVFLLGVARPVLVSRAARRCPILPAINGPRWDERWRDRGDGEPHGGSSAVAGACAGRPEWRPFEPAAFAQSPGPPRVSREGGAACHARKAV